MLYSLINDGKRYYINLHAECALHTYVTDFMDEENREKSRQKQGIYCNKINAYVLNHMFQHPYENMDICIQFNRIEEMSDNNVLSFGAFIKRNFCAREKNVYLLNLSRNIWERMDMEDYDILEEKDNVVSVRVGRDETQLSYQEVLNGFEQAFSRRLEEYVRDCTDELEGEDEMHISIPVYLSKYIDVKKMAEDNPRFFGLCIYYLGMKVIEKGIMKKEYYQNSNMSLFFHTMNGAYIATQLAQLFNVDMVYLDHLGPNGSVHRKHFEQSIADNKKYVIVSDVICLGGEVSRAKTIIEYCGGRVSGEICVVEVQTIAKRKKENRASLYVVSKEHNFIDYQIRTDLESKE